MIIFTIRKEVDVHSSEGVHFPTAPMQRWGPLQASSQDEQWGRSEAATMLGSLECFSRTPQEGRGLLEMSANISRKNPNSVKTLSQFVFGHQSELISLNYSGNETMACSPRTCGLHLSLSPDPSQEQAVVHQGSTPWEPTSLLNYLPVTADISPIAAYKSIHILLM